MSKNLLNGAHPWKNTVSSSTGPRKGIPTKQEGGGGFDDPLGKIDLTYTWGLRMDTNNHAEILALWQGLNLATERNVQNLVIFGDSRIIIQAIISKKKPKNLQLAQVYSKVILLLSNFRTTKIYHILRDLNTLADVEANKDHS
jgi:ribonuclease HI